MDLRGVKVEELKDVSDVVDLRNMKYLAGVKGAI